RRGAGIDVDILVDAGQVWNWKTALTRARQFQEFNIFWLEEPLHPEDVAGYGLLSDASPVPIAAGEAESRYVDFERLMREGRLDWIQPDPGRCGISTMVEVGRLAHRMHTRVVNHSFKSGITISASLHALAAVPHGEIFEFCMADSPLRHELTRERFDIDDEGFVHVPEGPGLGVTIEQDTIAKYRVG
ncbi:MAG TPA: mandelate racemase/muconate lactonizing enzyme family protein, partial [Candidatus Handelsmanbacteria bacterium]|nr:mandelate racemase/muconate lactonizing enzyme family protein [Candidatus Handelsmanbacteria bacterium]